MDSCFLQYKAPLEKDVNAIQYVTSFCQGWLVFRQVQITFIIIEVQIVSVTVHDKIEVVCISLEVYTYFSSAIRFCSF